MQNIDPLNVRKLRIHLAQLGTITPKELAEVAGQALVTYMTHEGMPDTDLTEEDGLHWKCRDLAKWMAAHPVLFDSYVQGKAIMNPSGRTCEINQGYRPGRI